MSSISDSFPHQVLKLCGVTYITTAAARDASGQVAGPISSSAAREVEDAAWFAAGATGYTAVWPTVGSISPHKSNPVESAAINVAWSAAYSAAYSAARSAASRAKASLKGQEGQVECISIQTAKAVWKVVLEKENEIYEQMLEIEIYSEGDQYDVGLYSECDKYYFVLDKLLSFHKEDLNMFQKAIKCAKGYYLLSAMELIITVNCINDKKRLWARFFDLADKLECRDLFENKLKNKDLILFTHLPLVLINIVVSYSWPPSHEEVMTSLKLLCGEE